MYFHTLSCMWWVKLLGHSKDVGRQTQFTERIKLDLSCSTSKKDTHVYKLGEYSILTSSSSPQTSATGIHEPQKKNRNAEVQTDEALFLCMYVCISCSQKKQMPELWGSKTLVSLWEASPRSKNTINRNKSLHQSHFWVRGKKKNADPFSCSYSKPEVS